ncbi:MAG: hypothetical protein MHPSP_000572 [Paramarteilia canceri]
MNSICQHILPELLELRRAARNYLLQSDTDKSSLGYIDREKDENVENDLILELSDDFIVSSEIKDTSDSILPAEQKNSTSDFLTDQRNQDSEAIKSELSLNHNADMYKHSPQKFNNLINDLINSEIQLLDIDSLSEKEHSELTQKVLETEKIDPTAIFRYQDNVGISKWIICVPIKIYSDTVFIAMTYRSNTARLYDNLQNHLSSSNIILHSMDDLFLDIEVIILFLTNRK